MSVLSKTYQTYNSCLRSIVLMLAAVTGGGIIVMVAVTCSDVLMRLFGHPLVGVFDLVRIAGAVSMAAALPYTTAVKGHVAIEYFFQKLGKKGRIAVDSFSRLVSIGFFGILTLEAVQYGIKLQRTGEVTPTLQLPLFWVPWFIALCTGVMALVIFHNLFHPGKGLIKP